MMRLSPSLIGFFGLAIATFTGCSGPAYVPVSGRVTLDGKPVADAVIFFQPIGGTDGDGAGVGSSAKTDADGRFTLQASTPNPTPGALIGKHRVRIGDGKAASAAINPDSDAVNPMGKMQPKAPKDTIPAKYNTESTLEFDVPAGGTTNANFDLKSS